MRHSCLFCPFIPAPCSHCPQKAPSRTIYDSVVILALPLVTLTPSCLARATISIRFLEETACAILQICQQPDLVSHRASWLDVLGSVGLVVHEEEVQVAGVVDEESLVARRHHVAGLDVATVADLDAERSLAFRLFHLSCPPIFVFAVAIHCQSSYSAPLPCHLILHSLSFHAPLA